MRMKQTKMGSPRKTITSLAVMVKAVERGIFRELWPARVSSDASPSSEATPGQLNPRWVEWLMGFPVGWLNSEHSATP